MIHGTTSVTRGKDVRDYIINRFICLSEVKQEEKNNNGYGGQPAQWCVIRAIIELNYPALHKELQYYIEKYQKGNTFHPMGERI